MLTRYTYPVAAGLVLTEHWPVAVGDIRIEWRVEDGRVTAVSAVAPMAEADRLPTVRPSDTPGVMLDVDVGWSSRQVEVEKMLRTIGGLLNLFAPIEINFNHGEIAWEPENEEESQRLEMLSSSRRTEKADLNRPRHLGYELVARTMVSATAAKHYEIPLAFLRRGSRDIHAGRYIEAFYNLFFFLETQFAPGYSNPKKVKQGLQAMAVLSAMAHARARIAEDSRGSTPQRADLLAMTEEELIEHLVELRGSLHHHALRRRGIWHPDKPDEFREEAILLLEVAHKIAAVEAEALLFTPERDEELMRAAEQAGATLTLRVEAVGLVGGVRTDLQPLTFPVVGRRIDRAIIDRVHREFRRHFSGGLSDFRVLEYKIVSEDRSQVYAVWRCASQTAHAQSS